MLAEVIVGIDIGTQSLKVVVTDIQLGVLGSASSAYGVSYPKPGWAEQNPRLWEDALAPTIAAALSHAGATPGQVQAIGLGGQLDGCIPVDRSGRAVHPCIIWMDRRAEDQVAGLPAAEILGRTGVNLDAGHVAAKIRWLKDSLGERLAGCVFHVPVSYLVRRLTGRAVFDHAHASTTMLYSLEHRGFDLDLLSMFGVATNELPTIADSADVAGALSAEGARICGLPQGIPVAVGTGDDFSTPLGAGVLEPGRLTCVLGTAEVVGALHPVPAVDQAGLVETHAFVGGMYFVENPGWVSGGALTWFLETFGVGGVSELDSIAASVPVGAEGLTFIPALSGAMAPEWNASARGCFYGLTLAHGTAHMARAVLEGTAFAMRDVRDRLGQLDVEIERVLLLGGGANSAIWAQMRADLTGTPVDIPRIKDTSPLGGAMLGAVAAGVIPDVTRAAERLGSVENVVEPDPANKPLYDQAYQRYRALFESLRPMFEKAD